VLLQDEIEVRVWVLNGLSREVKVLDVCAGEVVREVPERGFAFC